MLKYLIGALLGFAIAQQLYSRLFDPLQYWQQAQGLAAQAYHLACVEAGLPGAECQIRAKRYAKILSGI